MNIIEAAQAMRDGKRVRLPWWAAPEYLILDFDGVQNYDDCPVYTPDIIDELGGDSFMRLALLLSTDWEIVK